MIKSWWIKHFLSSKVFFFTDLTVNKDGITVLMKQHTSYTYGHEFGWRAISSSVHPWIMA